MATFTQLGSGNWRVQVRRKNRYVAETFRRRKDGEEWALEMERNIDRNGSFKPRAVRNVRTFGDLIDLHDEDMREVGKPPRRSKAAVMASLKAELGSVKLLALNRERLIEFGRKRAKQGAGPATLAIDLSFTRRDYLRYIKLIEDEFGDLPIAALADRRIRGDFKSWRDKYANTPRKADLAWTVLARILSFAKDRGIITTNPCERGGRLYVADRKDKIWTEQDIAAVLAVASSEIQLALILALWSGQRQGDLLRLPWSAYASPYIRLRQSKGGRRVAMPAGGPLRALLDTTERRGPLILTNTLGRPWTSDGFRTSWAKACERAGISGLTFHDLRGTAVVRLAIAGASVPQIAAVTGHSLKDVEAILDAHYLGRDIQLAEAAVLKLEARTKL